MFSFSQSVVEIMGCSILRRHISALLIARQLTNRFHAGCTTIDDLHKVKITSGLDGDAHLDTIAHLQGRWRFRRHHLSLDGDATLRSLDI